jgi:hypothetical protein
VPFVQYNTTLLATKGGGLLSRLGVSAAVSVAWRCPSRQSSPVMQTLVHDNKIDTYLSTCS